MIYQQRLVVPTEGRGTYEITRDVGKLVTISGIGTGLCNVFVRHTSASLMVCENADPRVRRDLETFMSAIVPDGDPRFTHTQEGPDDMPAHVRSVITQPSISVPVCNGRCELGTWQGIYLWEHRMAAHEREILITICGVD